MKTNINYSQYNNINNKMLMHKRKAQVQQSKAETKQEYNKNQIRPAQAISFGGSIGLNKLFHSTVEFVYDNEAAYNAIYSLIIAGMLKPLFVLNMPGSEEKDKQIVATKNFLQAFLGSFLSLTIGGGFIKKAIDVVKNNRSLLKIDGDKIEAIDAGSTKALEIAKSALKKEKTNFKFKINSAKEAAKDLSGLDQLKAFYKGYSKAEYIPNIDEIVQKASEMVENLEHNHLKIFQKNPEFVKNILKKAGEPTDYAEAFDVFWKNSTGAMTGILKAKISSLLLPGVMAFLFAKKNLEKQHRLEEAKKNSKLNKEQNEFRQMLNKNNYKNIAFKGSVLTSAIDGTASLIEKVGMSKFGEGATKVVSTFKKPSARMADLESIIITGYWVQNTLRSKKIEPSQKLGLNVHSILVTAVSSTAAFIIDWALDGLIGQAKDKYKSRLKDIVNQIENKNSYKGLDEIIKDAPSAVKMGIEDEVVRLLDSKITKDGLKEVTNTEVKTILDKLRQLKTFEGSNLTEDIIEKAITALKNTEPTRKEILELSQDMLGSKKIAKELSRAIGDEKAIDKAINSLTSSYGKKLSKFKSLTIFTLVVRFLVPVLMVPFSGKLKKKIVQWQEKRIAEKKEAK